MMKVDKFFHISLLLFACASLQGAEDKVAMLRKYACQNPGDELVREKVAQAERRGRERTPACRYAETFTTFDGQPIDGGVLEELPETARVG